jgi:ankyrin repeat protein
MAHNSSESESDAVFINHDDISNYNPEQILPESEEEIKRIRNWLNPTAYNLKNGEYRKHLASHVAGTGTWFTSSSSYQEWLTGKEYGMLWVKGIPGSGKSVLAAMLTAELARTNPGVPVLYFYFRQIIDANHEPVALLRDYLDQVLEYSPPLQQQLKKYVTDRRSLDSLSMEDLWKDLRLALAGLSGKVFCIADALDEMDQGNDAFLAELAGLGQWKTAKVKVLVTSRPVPSVEGPLRSAKALHVRLQEQLVDIDISSYVQHGLDTSAISASDQELIKEAVPGRANGLFLYAKLAMDAFLEPGAKIDEILRSLPLDLNDMYTNLLQEHARRSGVPDEIQLLILQWVTHATRPLRLLELAEMINVTYRIKKERDLKATKDLVRAAVGPLLEILPDETVCVIHHSFTEYLNGSTRSPSNSGYPILRAGPTHERLALSCLEYLQAGCLDQIKLRKTNDDDSDEETEGWRPGKPVELAKEKFSMRLKYPFLAYAAANWHLHVLRSAAAGSDQTKINAALDGFLKSRHRMGAWLKLQWTDDERSRKRVTKLHIAAKLGLTEYARLLLSSDTIEVDTSDVFGKTPLWWAATSGNAEIIRLLVKAGANPDHHDKIFGLKPLHEAAEKNHFESTRALLEAGVDPLTKKMKEDPGNWCGNAPRSTGHTPLMYACHNGHLEVVDVILSFIKDVNTAHRALAWAAERGHGKLVERILQHPGVNVNETVRGDTPLFIACRNGDAATIITLINAGADPSIHCESSRDEFAGIGYCGPFGEEPDPTRGFTALHALCGWNSFKIEPEDHQSILSQLVDAGANINHRTPNGATALHEAVNNPVLVRLLLDLGADANAVTDDGNTPLHLCTNLDSMTLLIEQGHADINKATLSDQLTPLLSLINSPNEMLLIRFLEYHPDVDVKDNDGNGALHIAVKGYRANPAILKALLATGCNPNLRNSEGQTPLYIVSLSNSDPTETLNILLEAGADINIPSKDGTTMLFKALSKSRSSGEDHKDLKLLLDRGASTDIRDSQGRTILHEAIKQHGGQPTYLSSYDPKISRFEFLVGLGLDIHAVDNKGNNLLHELAMHPSCQNAYNASKYLPLWKDLVNLGLDLNSSNNQGRTPLHILCSQQESCNIFKIGEFLPIDYAILSVSDLNCQDQDGITPLHLAVTCSEVTVRRMLQAGADATIPTFEGLTPLHLAARSRQANIVGLILELLKDKRKTVIDSMDKNGWTPLLHACRSARPETVKLLLEYGAGVNYKELVSACAQFEEEQKLWDKYTDPEANEHNLDAGGLLLDDQSRPLISEDRASDTFAHEFSSNKATARIYGLIDILKEHGVNSSTLESYFSSKEVKFEPLEVFNNIEKGKSNQSLFSSLLSERQYAAIEHISQLGVDFLEKEKYQDFSNLELLAQHGFASLLETMGNLEAEAKFKEGSYHAFGDNTKQGLFTEVDMNKLNEVHTKRTPLLLGAVQRELPNMEIVKLLVEKFHVNVGEFICDRHWTKDDQYELVPDVSPMHYLAKGCFWWNIAQALPYLINKGADLNIRNYKGQTPLHIALGGQRSYPGPYHKESARILIEAGADVNAVDESGDSCLAYAGKDIEMMRLLMEHGANLKADALFSVIDGKQVDILEVLLASGANPNMRRAPPPPLPKDHVKKNSQIPSLMRIQSLVFEDDIERHEWYPVQYAATKQHDTSSNHPIEERRKTNEAAICLVETLLKHGADPFATFKKKDPFSKLSEEDSDDEDTSDEDDPLADLLIPDPLKQGLADRDREYTVLHDLLINEGLVHPFLDMPDLDSNYRDAQGRTPLHAACRSILGPDAPIDSLLLGREQKSTYASFLDHLLQKRADPLARDNEGRNSLHHICSLLESSCSRESKGLVSLKKLAKQYPSLLLDCDKDGRTPFHAALIFAMVERDTELAEALLEAGADPKAVDSFGNTSLHFLAYRLYESPSVRKLFAKLVQRGLDINATNKSGETPVFNLNKALPSHLEGRWGVDEKHVSESEPLALFDAAGADFFGLNNKGQGLLHVAAKGHKQRFKMLMDKGLDPMAEDHERRTALDVAAACANQNVLELFERGDGYDAGGKKL